MRFIDNTDQAVGGTVPYAVDGSRQTFRFQKRRCRLHGDDKVICISLCRFNPGNSVEDNRIQGNQIAGEIMTPADHSSAVIICDFGNLIAVR